MQDKRRKEQLEQEMDELTEQINKIKLKLREFKQF